MVQRLLGFRLRWSHDYLRALGCNCHSFGNRASKRAIKASGVTHTGRLGARRSQVMLYGTLDVSESLASQG